MKKLITHDILQSMIDSNNREYVEKVVGRALIAIMKRQTDDERIINETKITNNIGFTGADARSGTITAKYFLKHKRLENWQIERWLKRGKNGYSRITKYSKQLNEIANEKSKAA